MITKCDRIVTALTLHLFCHNDYMKAAEIDTVTTRIMQWRTSLGKDRKMATAHAEAEELEQEVDLGDLTARVDSEEVYGFPGRQRGQKTTRSSNWPRPSVHRSCYSRVLRGRGQLLTAPLQNTGNARWWTR